MAKTREWVIDYLEKTSNMYHRFSKEGKEGMIRIEMLYWERRGDKGSLYPEIPM
ncbi:MAG: hypothetical protein P4L28_05480 [Paludibacteraceae bacterium]|nr:hypothetical protein [Paludibacteraceae bacterium]